MTRTPRTAAALLLALALTACGGESGDDPTVAAPSEAAAPAVECPVQPTEIPAPDGVGDDLGTKPAVPANSAAPATVVQVADIVEGDGEEAVPGAQVAVKYVGALDTTGVEFDSSWSRGDDETLPYQVCGQDVVTGFSVAPLGMKEGGRRLVRIPDAFGYPGGNPQAGIPAGAVITFVIDLVEVS